MLPALLATSGAEVVTGATPAPDAITRLTGSAYVAATPRAHQDTHSTGTAANASGSTSTPAITQVLPTDLPFAPAPSLPASTTPATTSTGSTTLGGGSGAGGACAAAFLTASYSPTTGMAGAVIPGSWALPGQVTLRPSASPD